MSSSGTLKSPASIQNKFLNSIHTKRRKTASSRGGSSGSPATDSAKSAAQPSSEQAALTSLAIAELVQDAARGSIRAAQLGATTGWRPLPRPNKRFLGTTIRSVVTHNRRQAEGTGRPAKSVAELEAIIARGARRERRLMGDVKYSWRKPKRPQEGEGNEVAGKLSGNGDKTEKRPAGRTRKLRDGENM